MDGQHHISRTVSLNRGGRAVSWDTTSTVAMDYTSATSRSEHRSTFCCLHAHPTNVVASPSSWSPQPRVPRRRAASIHYLRSEHITGRGPERYPRESMAVVSVVRVRARDCICGRHTSVKVIFTAAFRHYRNDFSRLRDTLRWGRISGTTWNVWRHCMVCDFPRMRSVVIRYHRTERTISSLGALSAWICLK